MDILDWPTQSPDLNPFEMVWGIVETELGEIWERAPGIDAGGNPIHIRWRRVTNLFRATNTSLCITHSPCCRLCIQLGACACLHKYELDVVTTLGRIPV